jgi:putative flippase GtrA
MVTSLVGMHVFVILRNVLVKFEHAELISSSASITFSQSVSTAIIFQDENGNSPKKNFKHKETNLIT